MLPTRDCVRQTPAYTPGEQPQTAGFTKLNTNENPYPPPAEIDSIPILSPKSYGKRRRNYTA